MFRSSYTSVLLHWDLGYVKYKERAIQETFDKVVQKPWVLPTFTRSSTSAIIEIFDLQTKRSMIQITLDDLWPHTCWGHMGYDSTQGSLCPNPIKIHQSRCCDSYTHTQENEFSVRVITQMSKCTLGEINSSAVFKTSHVQISKNLIILKYTFFCQSLALECDTSCVENCVRNGSDRKPETGKTCSIKLALLKTPIGASL